MDCENHILLQRDIVALIGTFLSGRMLLKCMTVCKTWNDILKPERESRTRFETFGNFHDGRGIRRVDCCIQCEDLFYDCHTAGTAFIHFNCYSPYHVAISCLNEAHMK